MASNIVPGNVDGTFPVAGKDNSSQGFRDNFTAIKNNFTNAKTEIETLQTHSVKTNEANSFNDNVVSRAVLKDTSETIYAHGTTSGNITINHESGHYQTMTTNGAVVLAFTNMPTSSTLGRIILDITVAPTSTGILTFPSAVIKADNVTGSDGTSDQMTIGLGRALFEFMSPDGGTTVLMHQIGKQYV